ncbi:MAG TPA: penicillin-binding protein 2 [Candidatus Hydrogenedentes bacterium]|nr:penicillin-binding protein 2 [Candidatus Hydrogenedentota bacterium]
MTRVPREEAYRFPGLENRVTWLSAAVALAMALLAVQLWRLQVLQGPEYARISENNRISQKRLPADRGVIVDRNGEILADNRASSDIVFIPGECPEDQRVPVCRLLGSLLNVPTESLISRMEALRGQPFTQITVKSDITKADRTRMEELGTQLPGVMVVAHPQRRYHFGETAGQILGYLGEINQEELDARADQGYYPGDLIGKDGLERYYESRLRGRDGFMLVTRYAAGQPQLLTDKLGRPYIAERDTLGHILNLEAPPEPPQPGATLHLTLDIGLQKYCEDLLGGRSGAIVVLDADTGEVLALASRPGYDPAVFVTRGRNEERLALLRGERPNPMTHRAFREIYPPGSVFKVLMAAAALETGVIAPKTSFFCPGRFSLKQGGRDWKCWKRSGHGSVSVVDALAYSCDVFFYNVGLQLDIDQIAKYGRLVGYGAPTGIDLPGEAAGVLPDREWKARAYADKPPSERRWYPGDTVNLSIGQGGLSTTPLQNAVMMACVVNGGYRVRPRLWRDAPMEKSEKVFSDATLRVVLDGMRKCVEDGPPPPTGTGHAAFVPGMTVVGKTGSAQIMGLEHHERYKSEEEIPEHMKDHAWFVAGVVDRTPRLAICILVEHGHHGSSAAAPLAKGVIEYFYNHHAESPATGDSPEESD